MERNQAIKKTYRAHEAQDRYQRVRLDCRSSKKVLQPEIHAVIVQGLETYWSPEQIIGRQELAISVSTIYRALWAGLLPLS